MKRDILINVLLIIAGIALAIALFGAGAFWRSRAAPKKSSELLLRRTAMNFSLTVGKPGYRRDVHRFFLPGAPPFVF